MFKRIKVITLLISVLLVLGIMQLISAGIFINALNNDKENFTVSQLSSQNVAEFTDAWRKTCWPMPRPITINTMRCRKRRVWTSTWPIAWKSSTASTPPR